MFGRNEMQNVFVISSNIDRVGYKLGHMYIRFNSGVAYCYDKVPFEEYTKMIEAESAGQYFHQHIKGKFEYHKLDYDPFKSEQKAA
jgi:hypothetical protein